MKGRGWDSRVEAERGLGSSNSIPSLLLVPTMRRDSLTWSPLLWEVLGPAATSVRPLSTGPVLLDLLGCHHVDPKFSEDRDSPQVSSILSIKHHAG